MKEKSVKTKLERLFGHLRENRGRSNYKSVKKGRYPLGNGESLSIVDLKLLKFFFWDGVTFIGICGILLFKKILMSNLSPLLGEIWIVNYLEMIHDVHGEIWIVNYLEMIHDVQILLIFIIWCCIHLVKYVQYTIKELKAL
jgi:hypothetical protein